MSLSITSTVISDHSCCSRSFNHRFITDLFFLLLFDNTTKKDGSKKFSFDCLDIYISKGYISYLPSNASHPLCCRCVIRLACCHVNTAVVPAGQPAHVYAHCTETVQRGDWQMGLFHCFQSNWFSANAHI